MSFSSWMTELRTQEQHDSPLAHIASSSLASSWAETDCDSDSDSEFGNYVFFSDNKARKCTARKLTAQRTAPISIPQRTHAAHSLSSFEFLESPVLHAHEVEDYGCRDSTGAMDINEEDLMLFGNLAYFRTQHGAKSGLDFCQRTPAPLSSTEASEEDDQIFDMEM